MTTISIFHHSKLNGIIIFEMYGVELEAVWGAFFDWHWGYKMFFGGRLDQMRFEDFSSPETGSSP